MTLASQQGAEYGYDGLDGLELVGEDGALVAGRETTAGRFRTEARLPEVGMAVELVLHVTEAVEAGDDFLVTVGSYPRQIRAVEEDNTFAMMEAVDHSS